MTRDARTLVVVDVALLAVSQDRLCVLLRRGQHEPVRGRWSLPSSFLHEGEQLLDTALRALADQGLHGQEPTVLGVFDGAGQDDRDSRGPVLCVACSDVVPAPEVAGPDQVLAPVDERWPGRHRSLPFDQDRIVAQAVAQTQAAYASTPDPYGLLGPESFTLTELRTLHEAVLDESLQRDTFARRMKPQLVETDEQTAGTVGRPSQLYLRA